MKKIIGITPLWHDRKQCVCMEPGYMESVQAAGGIPIILPLTDSIEDLRRACDLCDGFLFSGGHDVEPEMYGEEPLENVLTCGARDRMEKIVLAYALEKDKAVLGICRGIQLINTVLGGNLYQDIPTQCPSSTQHNMTPPYNRVCHKVSVLEGTPLDKLLGSNKLWVNSYHHQAVKEPALGLVPMAVSEDGLVEALYMPDKRFVWAVQWHPENTYETEESSRKILEEFVRNS